MSKQHQQEDALTVETKVDPQALFQLFSPTLHFESPKPSTRPNWFVIAEQLVPTSQHAFWETIRRWTFEPQFVIPPVDKAEVTENDIVEKHVHDCCGEGPIESYNRRLHPKRKAKDSILDETVEYYETSRENRVIYLAKPSKENELPFYYPKVKAYSFVYESNSVSRDGQATNDPAEVENEEGTLKLEIIPLNDKEVAITDKKMQYALKSILHKLFKWCIQQRIGYKKKANHDVLVSKETYQSKYQYLKAKYGPELIANWTEKTDPKKFVYEDLAIASYLICLWKEEELKTKRKQNFVDLGCGNGLLTYLLVSEGYEGYGVDLADRKIWTRLSASNSNILRVETLYPSDATFPHTEWLIGNHADELVPWIPIIASKSGENCKFMVIPCCFYALDGTRSLSLPLSESVGKYRAYTDYVKEIARKVGYVCEEDYLRIPSTKNIAIVGRVKQSRPSSLDNEPDFLKTLTVASRTFIPRKTDREKQEERQESSKKPKLEK